MSSITIKFNLDNAVFDDDYLGPNIAVTLEDLACLIRKQNREFLAQPGQKLVVRDGNGNSIGKATFEGVEILR